jgi:hypothetical protein
MSLRSIILLSAMALTLLGSGCATAPNPDDDDRDRATSSIPWNRPQSWEGGGMGGMRPPGSGGGY